MSRRFIAVIVAASLAITGITVTQAQAGDKRTRNLILGVTTLAIIGAAIAAENRNDRDQGAYPPRGPGPGIHPRPVPPRVSLSDLPRRCLQNIKVPGGHVRLYRAWCMKQNYRYFSSLPNECKQKLWTPRADVWGYSPQCLRQYRDYAGNWINRR